MCDSLNIRCRSRKKEVEMAIMLQCSIATEEFSRLMGMLMMKDAASGDAPQRERILSL
jgi:hypothetical protein